MPFYDFRNKKTGETEERLVHLSEYDDFLKDNPHLERVLSVKTLQHRGAKNVDANIDVGFREVLNKVREAHPLGTIKEQR